VTFSPDHSASVGLSIFSGFAFLSALVLIVASRVVYPAGQRWPALVLGVLAGVAGLAASVAQLRTDTMFFVIVSAWALASGVIETIAGARGLRDARRRQRQDASGSESRDALTVGILTVVLGIALLLVPTRYALQYTIEDADATFTLTGIIIGVGIFGGYAAIIAVYLAVAGFSPRKVVATASPGQGATSPGDTTAPETSRATVNDERGTP